MATQNTTANSTGAPTVGDLPPSAKLVYKVLEYEGSLTQDQVATESRLCSRTVRYALVTLENDGFVTSRVHLKDARQSVYRLTESEDPNAERAV